MSDSEGSVAAVVVEEEVNDLASAVRRVCKNALAVDGLARGLHEGRGIFGIFWVFDGGFLRGKGKEW